MLNTAVSKAVLQLIQQSTEPLSVQQLLTLLKEKNINPNKTTVYRIIDKFMGLNILNEVVSNTGTSYYEQKQKHHHHFFCKTCGNVYCLKNCLIDTHNIQLQELLPSKGFQLSTHDFNLYGTCELCSTEIKI
jgi:Fe2+ or Zn2+ uptake regulation protein